MIRLYGTSISRWTRPYWLLRELDLPFEPVPTSPMKGDTRTESFLAKNPFGKVPVLEDGDLVLFESGAICWYLAETYGDGRLLPRSKEDRARCAQWVAFAGGDLEAPLWRMVKHTRIYPDSLRIPAEVELAKSDFAKTAKALERTLGDYAVGQSFSVADVMLASTLRWAASMELLGEFPKLRKYMEKHTGRASFPAELYR